MTDTLNLIAALLTIAFGAFGFLAPRFTARALDLQTGASTMGLSELRASVGCLFIGASLGAIWIGTPTAWAMLGFVYAGAATGRLTSLLLDKPPFQKAALFFAIEALLAIWLLAANL